MTAKKLAKMEKEITTGLNMKLVDEQIISISEAITSNREAFNKIASNTITSLIQSAPDANAIALGITDGFITDPILRMIWPELNPNEKQELTKNAMDFAKKIETQRKEADEEKENKLEEYLKDIDIKRINSEDLKERTNLTNQLSNANYWQSTEAKEEAYEELEELSNAGKISFAEKKFYRSFR